MDELEEQKEQIKVWLGVLESHDLDDRIMAIRALADLGDEDVLWKLREHMTSVHREYETLTRSIRKMKGRLDTEKK